MNEKTVLQVGEEKIFPMLALRGISVFPNMILNFDVERPASIAALNAAMAADQNIFLVAQKDIAIGTPKPNEIYKIGTVSRITQILKIPGGNAVRVMVQGLTRAKIIEYTAEKPCYYTKVTAVPDAIEKVSPAKKEATLRHTHTLLEDYLQLTGVASPEMLIHVIGNDDITYVADYITQNIFLKFDQKQVILEEKKPLQKLTKLNSLLLRELEILTIEQSIQEDTQDRMSKAQRDYYLREQVKAIQTELNDGDDPIE